MKPSRLIAGMIAGTCGAGLGVAFLVWQGDQAFAGNLNLLKIDVGVAFGISYGLFWLADRFDFIADPLTEDTTDVDVYAEKRQGDHHESR